MTTTITAKQAAEAVAITDTARFWIGRSAAGRVIFDREPNPADYPWLTIEGYVCMPLIREGDKLAAYHAASQELDAATDNLYGQAPAAPAPQCVPTAQHIHAAARKMCDLSAEACGVNKDDNWAIYGDAYNEEAKAVLAAAFAVPATPVKEGADL